MTNPTDFFADSFKVMADGFSKAVQNGTKVYEENARFWSDWTSRSSESIKAQFDKLGQDLTPFSRTQVDRFSKLFDEQMKRGFNVMRETFEFRPNLTPAEATERFSAFWQTCFTSARETGEAVAKSSNELFQSWVEVARDNPVGKAVAKAAAK